MYNNKFALLIIIFIIGLCIGYFFAKNKLPTFELNQGNQSGQTNNKVVQGDILIDSSVINASLGLTTGSTQSVNLNLLNKVRKNEFKSLVQSIEINNRIPALDPFPNFHFYGNDGKFYFYNKQIPFQLTKIDQDDDLVRFFNICALPRIQGKIPSENIYLKDKIETINLFYTSDWQSLEGSNDDLAKILFSFHKNGHCDITDPNCRFYNNPKKMRAMIRGTMEEFKDIYKISTDEGQIETQIDLYLSCTLPKYTQKIDLITPFLNQIGPFNALLGESDTIIINRFFDSLNEFLAK